MEASASMIRLMQQPYNTGLDFPTIKSICSCHARFFAIPLSDFVDNFSLYKLSKRMGTPGEYGCTLIGSLVSAMLYGITTLQTYLYYMHYSEDGLTMKFVVAAVWIFDTLHTALMCHMLYYYLIINWGVPTSLDYIVWSFPASLLANLLVVTIVQFFFAHKIYHLCRRHLRWLVTAPIILLALAHVGFAMVTVVVLPTNNSVSTASHIRPYAAIPALSSIVLAEVLITVSLCVLLYESGSCSVVSRTKRLLNTLIIYAVNRCLLTLPVVIAQLVTVDAAGLTIWPIALDFIISKLYANSLLASLNIRQHLRSQASGPESDLPMSTVHFANPPKPLGDIGGSMDGVRRFDEHEVVVIDITTELAFGQTMRSGRETEV